ncbi:beta strand repeat-containing protein [Hansschlegelia plantiphila]|uniref:Calcium-binding protein n=1 Tax=Hansschlegelia plantiphila TaxID=374655 RepID=A0A9W6IZI9_9HYPH|nr:calcium-binding protein [Hansschlegelia plantiphila]GLK67892.1 hypothetical protein GCM10008179_15300 [Hansschlegelia plantiphila]
MTVTISYSLQTIGSFAYELNAPQDTRPDVCGLTDGAFAVATDDGTNVRIKLFNSSGSLPNSFGIGPCTEASLANGGDDRFIGSATGADGYITLFSGTSNSFGGGQRATSTSLAGTSSHSDISAQQYVGTVAVAWQQDYSATDHDIWLSIHKSSDLSEVKSFAIDQSAADDENASVAVLSDGGIVVAWDRTDAGGRSAIWYATYNADGSVRTAAAAYDDVGDVNRHPSVAAARGGGFTISYEDNESGATEVAVFARSPDGRTQSYVQVTHGGGEIGDTATAAIGLFGGVYATAFTQNLYDGGELRDQDIYVTLTDPATGRPLTGAPILIDGSVDVTHSATIAAIPGGPLGGPRGEFVVSYQDDDAGEIHNRMMQIVETITGDSAANFIQGVTGGAMKVNAGKGADVINDSPSGDSLSGGAGDDRFIDGLGDDRFDGGADTDTVEIVFGSPTTVDLRLTSAQNTGVGRDTFISIENLTGSSTVSDTFTGNDADNVLNGGGRPPGPAGHDVFAGGGGDDTYIIGQSTDVVTEAANAGTDTVKCDDSYTLPDNVENLILLNDAYDGSTATGNALANQITGNVFANVIDGKAGADTMAGGGGADTYTVDNAGDKVVEANVAGPDLVNSSVTFALAGQYVEDLTLTGSGNINGTGNSLKNHIIGNSGNNVIDGGTDADTMDGGAGNDTYYVQNAGDQVIEANVTGHDLVKSSVTFSLAGQYAEDLTLTGSAKINGTGNSLDNTLTGNAAVNTLTGAKGDDDYYVQNSGDKAMELDGQGDDRVLSSVSYSLAGQFIERLRLTGDGDVNGTGNSLANTIAGNTGDNVLDGGKGTDRIAGGAGRDTFVFANALGASNVDVITDFKAADDTIRLENGVFTGLSTGALASSAFYAGTAAHDSSDRIIYDASTGALLFDRDGTGATYAAVRFATLENHAAISAADFTVV